MFLYIDNKLVVYTGTICWSDMESVSNSMYLTEGYHTIIINGSMTNRSSGGGCCPLYKMRIRYSYPDSLKLIPIPFISSILCIL